MLLCGQRDMAGLRVTCGVFGQPGAQRFACVTPSRMQRAVAEREGYAVARYDSEDECGRECTLFARLPPELAEEVGTYLSPPALATVRRVAYVAAPMAAAALESERAACLEIAERFPGAWRLLPAGGAPGGAFRADPARLARVCREWGGACATRPCGAILARMGATFSLLLTDEDADTPEQPAIETDVAGDPWWKWWYLAGPLSAARFRDAPGNAPFYTRPAPVRALYGVGEALPVFLPGNTVRADVRGREAPRDVWGIVDGMIVRVVYDYTTQLIRFVQQTTLAGAAPRMTMHEGYEEPDVEELQLEFQLPRPPELAARPGENRLAASRRYADYANSLLGARLFEVSPYVLIGAATGAEAVATRYFATNGFPASLIRAHTMQRVPAPPG